MDNTNPKNQIDLYHKKRRPYAYARVSTAHQETGLEAQVRQINEYCERQGIHDVKIFSDENQSGAKRFRPGLDQMMKEVREGHASMVIVPSFSRLARSTTHLLKALDEFKENNVTFISLSEALDTNTAAGKMAFTVLAAVSQLERELVIERVKVGLANARAKGKILGRKKSRPSDMIRRLRKAGLTYKRISELTGVSHGSINAELREWKKEQEEERRKNQVQEKELLHQIKSDLDQKSKDEVKKIIEETKVEEEIEITRF